MMPRLAFLYLIWGAITITSSSCSLSSSISSSIGISSGTRTSSSSTPKIPPIVYTIAGSDSGGGAGIQADLHAIHAMHCHGCSAITCLTAQNSVGVTGVHAPPASFLKTQLETLADDLPPKAVKIGMLGNEELAITVGDALTKLKLKLKENGNKIWVVLDPVMISTSGHKLIDDVAIKAMIQHVLPHADVLTPNKFEAEALLGRKLSTPQDIEEGAKEILKMGCKSVLIKGGHTLTERLPTAESVSSEVKATLMYAQDFLLSSETPRGEGDERLCDGPRGVWLRTTRWDSENTHGTGCTLSSSIASALALGEQKRQEPNNPEGATSAIDIVDACCLAKAYVAAGIQQGVQLGKGPGPLVQTQFPSSHEHFPTIAVDPTSDTPPFRPMKAYSSENSDDSIPVLGRILPIVDTVSWVERLAKTPGVTDIQLRIKDENDPDRIAERAKTCQELCEATGVRLWINDHWEAAVKAGCFGVHVGQEDLAKCMNAGGLDKLRENNVALGISTHSYGELAAALGVKPSYISMGPVFATSSKKVQFDPQGLGIVAKWRQLIPPSIPFVTIGGIGDVETAKQNRDAGADCVAVIGAVTGAEDVSARVAELNDAMNYVRKS
jgi:hydroxymethylpyrimidine kinase/phosphomethylpyrimidine kinase/thiamine-phosphate diphosphorylase